jgi:hypothetical protein
MRNLVGFLFIITVLSWFQFSTLCADIYIWTDANGVKHYANEPPSGNSDVSQEAEQKPDPGLQNGSKKSRSRLQDEMIGKVPKGSDVRVTKNPGKVVMFTDSDGRDSKGLRDFFKEYKITYTEYLVDKDDEAKRRFEMLDEDLPYVIIGCHGFSGYHRQLLKELFGIQNP